MGLIWGNAKNATQLWGWVTGRRNEHVKMLPPHPCLLLLQIDPIALTVALVTSSARRNKLSKGPRFSALPPLPASVGKKKGSMRDRQISLR